MRLVSVPFFFIYIFFLRTYFSIFFSKKMLSRLLCSLFCIVFLLCSILPSIQAAVMSIDYGTEWFKVGLIKPGMPLDVALNKDSKRKTQSVVTFRNNERIYGSDAISLVNVDA